MPRLTQKEKKILAHAVSAIYFHSPSRHSGGSELWEIIELLSHDAYNLLGDDPAAAFIKYCKGVIC